jgi:hypothetical protein
VVTGTNLRDRCQSSLRHLIIVPLQANSMRTYSLASVKAVQRTPSARDAVAHPYRPAGRKRQHRHLSMPDGIQS